MALPLKKFSILCEEIAIASGKITPTSSPAPIVYEISRKWRDLLDATNFPSEKYLSWTEKEVAAGEIIISAVTFLKLIKCKNIETLLRDIVNEKSSRDE